MERVNDGYGKGQRETFPVFLSQILVKNLKKNITTNWQFKKYINIYLREKLFYVKKKLKSINAEKNIIIKRKLN